MTEQHTTIRSDLWQEMDLQTLYQQQDLVTTRLMCAQSTATPAGQEVARQIAVALDHLNNIINYKEHS